MAFNTRAGVIAHVDCIDSMGDAEHCWLDSLGVELPNLRRPRGQEGARDVGRYRGLPPALRAATVFFPFRAEISNGGMDQFVWNQLSILPETVDAFVHIGALGAAGEITELAEVLVRETPESLEDDAVARFLAFRGRGEDQAWSSAADPVDEVRAALLRHARARPEEFVLEIVERSDWENDRQRFRASILRRVDGRLSVDVELGLGGGPSSATSWYSLPGPAEVFEDIEVARVAVAEAQARRRIPPAECTFLVSSSSERDRRWTVWPEDAVPLDALPLGPIRATFTRGDERVTASGTFEAAPIDGRGYGRVVVDVGLPDTRCWPPLEPRWHARCVVA